MEKKNIEKFVDNSLKKEKPLTMDALKTNCILTSKKLIIEIESIEDKILGMTERDLNILLVLGARFELMLQEIKSISGNYFNS